MGTSLSLDVPEGSCPLDVCSLLPQRLVFPVGAQGSAAAVGKAAGQPRASGSCGKGKRWCPQPRAWPGSPLGSQAMLPCRGSLCVFSSCYRRGAEAAGGNAGDGGTSGVREKRRISKALDRAVLGPTLRSCCLHPLGQWGEVSGGASYGLGCQDPSV